MAEGMTLLQWITIVFVLFVTYFFISAIYNLYFSPLAQFPGPFWAKISAWPSWYQALKGDRHVWVWQCHEIYGSIFRYRPDGLLINSPTGHHSIYSPKANVTKGAFYKVWPRKVGETNTWNSTDRAEHASKRRVLNHVFSENAIRSAETFVIHHVDRWCELLGENTEKEWSDDRDMAHWANYVIFDILSDLCFGKSMEIKEPGKNELKGVPDFMVNSVRIFYPIAHAPFVRSWVWLKPRGLDSLIDVMLPEGVKIYYKWLDSCVVTRTKLEQEVEKQGSDQKHARKDMFHYLFQAKDPETGLSAYTPGELFMEAHLLTIAGSDTSTTTLAAVVFYLARYPRVYARLAEEIRTTFQTVDEIRAGPKLWACRYLRACLDEAMRMSPPAPTDPIREVLPGGLEVDGKFVPEGTQIGTGTYALHHNQNFFPDPFVYRPERWIVDEKSGVSAADVARAESAFSPFSLGTYSCVGKNLAYLMLSVSLARLLYQLDFKVPEGKTLGQGGPDLMWGRRAPDQFQVTDCFIASKQGPLAQFKRRHV